MRRHTRTWLLIAALTAGAIAGSIIGEVLSNTAPILAQGFNVGLNPPLVLDLNVIKLTLGFTLRLNVLGGLVVLLLVLLLGR
jgi:hypothetical protein